MASKSRDPTRREPATETTGRRGTCLQMTTPFLVKQPGAWLRQPAAAFWRRVPLLFFAPFFLPCPSLGQLLKMRYSRELPSARRFVSCKKPSAYLSDFFLTWNDCFDGRKRRRWARASYRHDSGEILCVHRLEVCSRAYRASISK